jgi:hypothetical protein
MLESELLLGAMSRAYAVPAVLATGAGGARQL